MLPTNGTAVGGDDVWEWDGAAWTEVTPAIGGPHAQAQDRFLYDDVLGRLLLIRPGQDAWAWDGARWQDVSPPNVGLPGGGANSLAFDGRGFVMTFAAVEVLGHTFRMETVTPSLQLAARAPADVDVGAIEDIRVRAFCSGTDPVAGAGARLLGWNGRTWDALASSPTGAALEHGLDKHYVGERDGVVYVKCQADADAPHPRSEVSLDYAEVRFKYKAQSAVR